MIGIVEFEKKTLSLDATLYDSQIAQARALRRHGPPDELGRHTPFALSLGGLNPRFQPPAGFPSSIA